MKSPTYPPGYRGFLRLCDDLGAPLAHFQREMARACFGPEREVCISAPRGHAKSTTVSLLALHEVASRPDASVFVGASARDQARVIGRIVHRYARHPVLADRLLVRTDQVRGKAGQLLQIVSADGAKAHGWERPSLMIGDEVAWWSAREPTLLGAMMTALVKNPEARLVCVSTAPSSPSSPFGRMRARALTAPNVKRDGARLEAWGDGLRWLEWSLPDDAEPDDIAAVAAVNVAPWITRPLLEEQRRRVSDLEWRQFHCNLAHVQSARWLPPGAWNACAADIEPSEEPLTLGIDIGGSRSATALVGVTADEEGVRVELVEVRQGRSAVLDVVDRVRQIAAERRIDRVVYDPMRFDSEALRLERELGLTLVEWPQSEVRMTRCSENLHRLVIEERLRHPGHEDLDLHVSSAIAQPTRRGWRLVKAADAAQIDAVIALAMAAEAVEQRPEPARFLGWV